MYINRIFIISSMSYKFSMNFSDRITKVIFPDEYVFRDEYYRGQPIFNQAQFDGMSDDQCCVIVHFLFKLF